MVQIRILNFEGKKEKEMGGHKTRVPRSQKRTSRIENFIENI
jgi:hypothetical protein